MLFPPTLSTHDGSPDGAQRHDRADVTGGDSLMSNLAWRTAAVVRCAARSALYFYSAAAFFIVHSCRVRVLHLFRF